MDEVPAAVRASQSEEGEGGSDDGFTSATPSEPAGRTALRRLLLAYAAHNQSSGYCQALNYLGAMLLLATDLQVRFTPFHPVPAR